MPKICEALGGLRFFADNTLEEYRAQSILTKEPETIAWIDAEFRNGGSLLDVGANVGIYSCYAGRANPGGRVLAVEPFRQNFARLCENVELNGFDNIVPLLIGFADRPGVETLFVRDERTGGSGSQIGHSHDEHGTPFRPVRQQATLVFTVDGFLDMTGLPTPQHIKVDVDGNEAAIVRGMTRTLADEALRSLLIELNLAGTNTEALIAQIESYGFTQTNPYNQLASHSRNRRRLSEGNVAENVIFTRTSHG